VDRRRHPGGLRFLPLWDQRPGFFVGFAFTLLLVLGILFWYLLFDLATAEAGKIITVEIIVNLITLGLNIFMICRVGYESFLHDFGLSYSVNVILSVIGLYIAGVQFISNPDGNQMIAFWRFALILFSGALMNLMPTILICLIMWIVMSIFGTYR